MNAHYTQSKGNEYVHLRAVVVHLDDAAAADAAVVRAGWLEGPAAAAVLLERQRRYLRFAVHNILILLLVVQ